VRKAFGVRHLAFSELLGNFRKLFAAYLKEIPTFAFHFENRISVPADFCIVQVKHKENETYFSTA